MGRIVNGARRTIETSQQGDLNLLLYIEVFLFILRGFSTASLCGVFILLRSPAHGVLPISRESELLLEETISKVEKEIPKQRRAI